MIICEKQDNIINLSQYYERSFVRAFVIDAPMPHPKLHTLPYARYIFNIMPFTEYSPDIDLRFIVF